MKLLTVLLLLICTVGARAQALPAGIGPGPHVMVGGGYSLYQADYGKRYLGGGMIYADMNLTWRWGLEAEARRLDYNRDPNGSKQSTYLIGPRYSFSKFGTRPYVKLLGGLGVFNYPFNYATGKYFVAAPGAGVELHRGRFAVKLVDVEYQTWPNFSFGNLHPYGVSTGITFRVWGSETKTSER